VWQKSLYKVSVGKPEGKRPKHRWEYDTKVNLGEIDWNIIGQINVAHDYSNKPPGFVK